MSQNPNIPQPQPVAQPTGAAVFDLGSDAERIAYMRQLGARNTDPPLPRSTHLRNKANGRVLPWEETLAEQRDLMECCDASGNTDPAAWQPFVDYSEYDPVEQQIAMLKAQEQAMVQAQARQLTSTHQVPDAVNPTTPQPMQYANDAVPYDEVEKLLQQMEA